MRRSILAGVGVMALMALVPASDAQAQTGAVWLHVRVEEALKPSKVMVNLPLSVVEVALEAAPEMIEKHGKMHLGEENGMKVADLRRVWKQLDAVGDAEFVTVESEQESVRIARRGDIVEIRVNEKKGAAPSVEAKAEASPKAESAKTRHAHGDVRVELPVSVVDALLSGEGEELDVKAAVAELQKRRGDIVRVVDQDSQVRIWIDEQNTQPAAR